MNPTETLEFLDKISNLTPEQLEFAREYLSIQNTPNKPGRNILKQPHSIGAKGIGKSGSAKITSLKKTGELSEDQIAQARRDLQENPELTYAELYEKYGRPVAAEKVTANLDVDAFENRLGSEYGN